MLSREFTYEDFKGNVRTETCWFGMTSSELTSAMLEADGNDLLENLKQMINANEPDKLLATFKKMILDSYGVVSPDGRRFDKSKELSEAFSHTPMFDMLYMELVTDAQKGVEFLKGIMPKEHKKFDKSNFDRVTEEVTPMVNNVTPMPQSAPVQQNTAAPQTYANAPAYTEPAPFPPIQ